jgi:hypothetical protein
MDQTVSQMLDDVEEHILVAQSIAKRAVGQALEEGLLNKGSEEANALLIQLAQTLAVADNMRSYAAAHEIAPSRSLGREE